jgi:hypothetical protein
MRSTHGEAHSLDMHSTLSKLRTPIRTANTHLVWWACGPISPCTSVGPVVLLPLGQGEGVVVRSHHQGVPEALQFRVS